jgi:hypothetical protein
MHTKANGEQAFAFRGRAFGKGRPSGRSAAQAGGGGTNILYRGDVKRSFHGVEDDFGQLAHDRYEIADALHRYAFGLDHGDADSLASALTEDCCFDFAPAGKKLGIKFPVVNGRESILKAVLPMIGPLDTSHTCSNMQMEIEGESATLYAYVMSQHFMPRQGSKRGTEFALLMNRYDCELVRDGEKWRFRRITIDNAWCEGDAEILTALATQRVLQSKKKETGG